MSIVGQVINSRLEVYLQHSTRTQTYRIYVPKVNPRQQPNPLFHCFPSICTEHTLFDYCLWKENKGEWKRLMNGLCVCVSVSVFAFTQNDTGDSLGSNHYNRFPNDALHTHSCYATELYGNLSLSLSPWVCVGFSAPFARI